MIAALYVLTNGPYFGLEGVDPWDEPRDARKYAGPHPVVAQPPCERWGRYWSGGPSVRIRRALGDDGGCFAAALSAVQAFGGVLEHPEASHAFRAFGLPVPAWRGGWTEPDRFGGRSACVAQGHYGHPARKLTWLYAVGGELPQFDWSIPAPRSRLDEGFHSKEERRQAVAKGRKPRRRLTPRENAATPPAFRDALIAIARSAHKLPRPNAESGINSGSGGTGKPVASARNLEE